MSPKSKELLSIVKLKMGQTHIKQGLIVERVNRNILIAHEIPLSHPNGWSSLWKAADEMFLWYFLFSDPFSEIEDDFVDAVKEYKIKNGWMGCRRRSKVWSHFLLDKLNRNRVKCKKCKMILEYVSSTTNMRRHMKRKHHELVASLDDWGIWIN